MIIAQKEREREREREREKKFKIMAEYVLSYWTIC